MSPSETVSEVDHLSEERRECIENRTRATEVCEWCADESLGSEGMEECESFDHEHCRVRADVLRERAESCRSTP